jgi:hypothetical protein
VGGHGAGAVQTGWSNKRSDGSQDAVYGSLAPASERALILALGHAQPTFYLDTQNRQPYQTNR